MNSKELPSWAKASRRLFLRGSEEWLLLKEEELRRGAPSLLRLSYPPEDPVPWQNTLSHRSLFEEERYLFIRLGERVKELEDLLPCLPEPSRDWVFLAAPGEVSPPRGFDLYTEEEDQGGTEGLPEEVEKALNELCEGRPLKRRYLAELLKLAAHPAPPRLEDLLWLHPAQAGFDGMRFAQELVQGKVEGAFRELERWEARGGSGASVGREILGAVGYQLRERLKEAIRTRGGRGRGRFSSPRELAALLDALQELDRLLKTTTLPPGLLLRQFVLRTHRGMNP